MKGEANGRAEGRAEGETARALAIAQNMLKRSRPIDEITEDTGLTRKEVERLRNTFFGGTLPKRYGISYVTVT